MSYPEAIYHGDTGVVAATFKPVSASADLTIGANVEVHYLATGASTGGRFGLYRWDTGPRAGGPGTHFHKTISESFFVLSGTVRVFDGERWIEAQGGDFLHVPTGGLHAFGNESDEPASLLLLFAPGAPREPYFETLAEVAAGRQFSKEELAEFFLRHDTYYV